MFPAGFPAISAQRTMRPLSILDGPARRRWHKQGFRQGVVAGDLRNWRTAYAEFRHTNATRRRPHGDNGKRER